MLALALFFSRLTAAEVDQELSEDVALPEASAQLPSYEVNEEFQQRSHATGLLNSASSGFLA